MIIFIYVLDQYGEKLKISIIVTSQKWNSRFLIDKSFWFLCTTFMQNIFLVGLLLNEEKSF